ncbi:hypothetical protein FP2506_00315 [Fulvimarina pelagi HTCC2506]|uniref:Uncharacterized protein n=1 Tax=Fulvimarina pelagi HTCC2506 TaxID=314231 RepID=Q0FXS2_9HYPH|nr:hypothetical protein [Fulvimarina pelagi]EAU39811.1 hypothetical protein FP2506_00315 [Fulvimarina pelagi HTCC2506]
MISTAKAATAVLLAAATVIGATAAQTKAYPIDCAILLCLSGGWPASAECSGAEAEVIRRITPTPIEPPVQIWRCPMDTGLSGMPSSGGGEVGVDFGSPAFDAIRSIRVSDIQRLVQYETDMLDQDGEPICRRFSSIRTGFYDIDGEYRWVPTGATSLPTSYPPARLFGDEDCPSIYERAVVIEWRDIEGRRDFETIDY